MKTTTWYSFMASIWVLLAIYYMVIVDSHDNVLEFLMMAAVVLLMGIYKESRR